MLKRPLSRPAITIKVFILFLGGTIVLGVALGAIICAVLQRYTIFPPAGQAGVIAAAIIFALIYTMRPMLIGGVLCYQHYAPETVRRSCLCKPTCSEYAILVLKRHCLVKALILIYIRLFRVCTGKTYKIDFP